MLHPGPGSYVRTGAVALFAATLACTRESPSERVVLEGLPAVRLSEDSLTYLGRPNGFAVTPTGTYIIADAAKGEVAEYDVSGTRLRTIGRKGSGPGELMFPASIAVSDSVVAVLDFAASRVALFASKTGAFLTFVKLPVRFWSMSLVGDTLVGAAVDPASGTVFETLTTSGVLLGKSGTVPSLFKRVPPTAAIFGQMDAMVAGGKAYYAFEVSDAIHVLDRVTGAVDSLVLPRLRRRGVRHDLLAKINAANPETAGEAVYQSSMPIKLGILSTGHVVLVTLDPKNATGRVSGQLYLSIVDPVQRRACPDLPLDLPSDPLPRVDIRGDTLMAVAQRIGPDSAITTTVDRVIVNPANCSWMATR